MLVHVWVYNGGKFYHINPINILQGTIKEMFPLTLHALRYVIYNVIKLQQSIWSKVNIQDGMRSRMTYIPYYWLYFKVWISNLNSYVVSLLMNYLIQQNKIFITVCFIKMV